MPKLAFRAQTVDIAYLPLHQDLLAKKVLMTAQRDFRFGQQPANTKGEAKKYESNRRRTQWSYSK
jgi:hypothetical protein